MTILALITASLFAALALYARTKEKEAWRAAAYWQRKAAENYADALSWMHDSSQQAMIIARLCEPEWVQVEQESVH